MFWTSISLGWLLGMRGHCRLNWGRYAEIFTTIRRQRIDCWLHEGTGIANSAEAWLRASLMARPAYVAPLDACGIIPALWPLFASVRLPLPSGP